MRVNLTQTVKIFINIVQGFVFPKYYIACSFPCCDNDNHEDKRGHSEGHTGRPTQ